MTEDRLEVQRLFLEFECIQSLPEGLNEVHVWWDPILQTKRVGKTIDISGMEADGSLPEPATLQAISHNNVVPVVAAALRPEYRPPLKVVELVTPYYPRGSITDAFLRGETFAISNAVATVQRALLGLAELHEVVGILHRDVKSGNILLSGDSHVAKLADLGLAARPDASGTTSIANNPTLYSPPEFRSGQLTVASDLFYGRRSPRTTSRWVRVRELQTCRNYRCTAGWQVTPPPRRRQASTIYFSTASECAQESTRFGPFQALRFGSRHGCCSRQSVTC